jgi:chromosomal replication initiation ATPase DnaA
MKQLILPFECHPTFEAPDFIVSSTNKDAYLWLMQWPHWPNHCFAIYGDEGCGKTHLSYIWQEQSQARRLESQVFNTTPLPSLLEGPNLFILDDAHLIEKGEKFFHFYNHLNLTKGALLLLTRTPPAHWESDLADLRSRLNTIPTLKIHDPDEELLCRLVQKLFNDLQLRVEENVIIFLLKHMERSFESAHLWVHTLNTYALTHNRSITIPLVRELLLQQERVAADSKSHLKGQ